MAAGRGRTWGGTAIDMPEGYPKCEIVDNKLTQTLATLLDGFPVSRDEQMEADIENGVETDPITGEHAGPLTSTPRRRRCAGVAVDRLPPDAL